ncbi:MAG: MauE/DoxX family redox-associated membrane protein, partial [Thermodesulfobacteriota bacterium]
TYGVKTLVSTYSFAQGPSKPVLSCPEGKPWTNCLDRPCTVDPMNPLIAVCKCDIVRDSPFVTYGGDCNTLTCDTGYWSGATVESYEEGSALLFHKMGLDGIPVTYCPGMKPKAD